jgi:hypothetical protein
MNQDHASIRLEIDARQHQRKCKLQAAPTPQTKDRILPLHRSDGPGSRTLVLNAPVSGHHKRRQSGSSRTHSKDASHPGVDSA